MAEGGRIRASCALLRNLVLAGLTYALIFGIIQVLQSPSGTVKGKLGIPAFLDKSGPADIIKTTKAGVKVKFATTSNLVTINPHANVFNRPKSAVQPKDDYMGPRPHVDTEADLKMLVEECRGTYNGIEKMRNVFDCLEFLSDGSDRYYTLPDQPYRASAQDPRKAEYASADNQNNTLSAYPSHSESATANKTTIGTCPGPIVPYHVYWTGPATWRVEVFIKSYLYTQNLACSRLWLWLDSDRHPNAVDKMLHSDPLFARFLPFVERGDIVLQSWKFPNHIPVPKSEDAANKNTNIEYYKSPGKPNSKGETAVADGIIEDQDGQQWLVLTPKQMTFLPQAVSDAVRFVVLHLHGGAYFDMDVLMLRDMRPLLLPKEHSFAERWAAHQHPGDYNTAVMSLTANSSLSSYLLRGGVRMGLNFHPRVIGRMAWKDGRDKEFLMLETAAFDPIWTEFNWDREGRCTVPCLRDYSAAFKGKAASAKDEWESYDGPQLEQIDAEQLGTVTETRSEDLKPRSLDTGIRNAGGRIYRRTTSDPEGKRSDGAEVATPPGGHEPSSSSSSHGASGSEAPDPDSFSTTSAEEAELRSQGVIAEYIIEEDKYPPNNRTLENFFRGAWTYHVHNQWSKHPEPSSWMNVLEVAHNGFFAGERTNPYGEMWEGPSLMPYNYWPEFV
ncbi:hypothetical protein K402DRAFT_342246 [Aulographum hederae CBS 113979]|uniref:SnoRNA binding protein-like protein n=1 Tax=Aulographum hederae CBS 113979 TaxID=1176131 RepID=A0A6G1GLF4_9PEZI|nr:hypothetical protein K402DRAFT_342246 [Aulographum hederae CBS 113979]